MKKVIGFVSLACVLPALAVGQNVIVETELIYGLAHGSALLADIGYPENGEDLPAIIYLRDRRFIGRPPGRAGRHARRRALRAERWLGRGAKRHSCRDQRRGSL